MLLTSEFYACFKSLDLDSALEAIESSFLYLGVHISIFALLFCHGCVYNC